MTIATPQNDVMSIAFINPTSNQIADVVEINGSNNITDATSINMEKDYFIPSNGLTIEIEDNRIYKLSSFLQRGWKIQVSINGNPNMVGYIWNYHLTYSHDGGTKLRIECKDLLEYMAQGTIYPNMGLGGLTNFHFQPTDTLNYALEGIAGAFNLATQNNITVIPDASQSLTFATGFEMGLAATGKTVASQIVSLQKTLDHLTMPKNKESYLAYFLRLCKMAGCNPKMNNNDESQIICKPPTYGYTNQPNLNLYHYLTAPNNVANNVLQAGYFCNLDEQPSVVVVESQTNGDNRFSQQTLKAIAVNEMTGFPFIPSLSAADVANGQAAVNNIPAIDMVLQAINQLTGTKTIPNAASLNLGAGYVFSPFNTNLYNTRGTLPIDINTQISLPYYTTSTAAHTQEEATYAARKLLAEHQDKYFEAVFRVTGWTDPLTGTVWQPDLMVNVTEEVFSPGSPSTFPMWIRRVNFIKNRSGTETEISCSLPYTHFFEAIS